MNLGHNKPGLTKAPTLGHAPVNPSAEPTQPTQPENQEPVSLVTEALTPEPNPEPTETFEFFSCAPLDRLKIGRFNFDKGQLKLTEEDAVEFEELMKKVDPRTRQKVKKIDVRAAEAYLRSLAPVATKSTDSSADGANGARRLIGTQELGS